MGLDYELNENLYELLRKTIGDNALQGKRVPGEVCNALP